MWSRATGVAVSDLACRYVLSHTETTTILDPFCGKGTILAVANAHGLDAVGVEIGPGRAKKARSLTIDMPSQKTPLDSQHAGCHLPEEDVPSPEIEQ